MSPKPKRKKLTRASNPMHSSASPDHGTPRPIIDLARSVLGGIDYDPFSSAYWNGVIGARIFRDGAANGDGYAPYPTGIRTVIVNPPGDKSGENVRQAWIDLVLAWQARVVESAIWVGFSLEQLVSLQKDEEGNPSSLANPLSAQFSTCILRRRPRYLQRRPGSAPIEGKKPTHGSYITWLPAFFDRDRDVELEAWRVLAGRLGVVSREPDAKMAGVGGRPFSRP